MGEQVHVDIVEDALAHEIRLGRDLLFGHTRPDQKGPINVLALHDLLHGERSYDVHGLAGVMSLTVPGGHANDRITIGDTGLLVRLWNPVDVGAQGDDRGPGAIRPTRGPRGRHAGDAELDVEALVFEKPRQITLGLELLHPQFSEREQVIDDLLHELGTLFDHLQGLVLE